MGQSAFQGLCSPTPGRGGFFNEEGAFNFLMRWTWWHFAAVAAVGVALTAISFAGGWPWGGLFLLLPLVFPPLRLGKRVTDRPEAKRCMKCGFESREPDVEFCPRDGTRLARHPGIGNL